MTPEKKYNIQFRVTWIYRALLLGMISFVGIEVKDFQDFLNRLNKSDAIHGQILVDHERQIQEIKSEQDRLQNQYLMLYKSR